MPRRKLYRQDEQASGVNSGGEAGTIANMLRASRTKRGISLQDLAEAVGVTPSYISKVELGTIKEPAGGVLVRMAMYLGWSLEDLFKVFRFGAGQQVREDITILERNLAGDPDAEALMTIAPALRRDMRSEKQYLGMLQALKDRLDRDNPPTIEALRASLAIPKTKMNQLMRALEAEMGLERDDRSELCGSLQMRHFVPPLVTGHEEGLYIGLDFGGSNVRVAEVDLKNYRRLDTNYRVKEYALGPQQKIGTEQDLMDLLVRFVIDSEYIREDKTNYLGFSVGFALEQDQVSAGTIIKLGKGNRISGILRRDCVHLLTEAFGRAGIKNIEVLAVANDTVSTCLAGAFQDPNCHLGLVVGTGFNIACKTGPTSTLILNGKSFPAGTIFNTESGQFADVGLAPTIYDHRLAAIHQSAQLEDPALSASPGVVTAEKMIAGEFMGEIVRLIVSDFSARATGYFRGWTDFQVFGNPFWFPTKYMSQIADDSTRRLSNVEEILNRLEVLGSLEPDRVMLREICHLVARRSAYLVATLLAGIITVMQYPPGDPLTIEVDGSVYDGYPDYGAMVKQGLGAALGDERTKQIELAFLKNSSGIGAAVMAAASKNRS